MLHQVRTKIMLHAKTKLRIFPLHIFTNMYKLTFKDKFCLEMVCGKSGTEETKIWQWSEEGGIVGRDKNIAEAKFWVKEGGEDI